MDGEDGLAAVDGDDERDRREGNDRDEGRTGRARTDGNRGRDAPTTAVCFDLDGTLVRFDDPYEAVTEGTFAAHLGGSTDDLVAAYDEAFFDAFRALEPEPYRVGMRAALERAESSPDFSDAAVAGTDVDALVATQREREFAASRVSTATRDCIDALAADEAVRVVVVTDGVGDWQRAKLAHHGLDATVDETVVSYDVGGHKRSGEPYAAVRERVAADEYVMVGDSYESDVEAARAAGFVPIHYEDDGADLFAILRAFL